MAGLALGASAATKIYGRFPNALGCRTLWSFAVLSFIVGAMINSGMNANIMVILFMLFLAGGLLGSIFAYAGLHNNLDQKSAVSPLYSADLIGGCLGSLVASLLLTPLAGLGLSAYLMIPLAVVTLLLL